jgi:hypothetical protein
MLFYIIVAAWLVWVIIASYKSHTGGHVPEWAEHHGIDLPGEHVGFVTFIVGGVLTSIFTLVVAAIFSSNGRTEIVVQHNVCPIVSLRGASEVSGDFFLGCGHIGADEKYYFIYDLGHQTYRRGEINTGESLIRETAGEKPNLSYDTTLETNRKCYKWWPKWYVQETWRNENLTLNVPPGTIIQKFEVQ